MNLEPEALFKYKRLASGGETGLQQLLSSARHELWMGSDHLLHIVVNGLEESYRRYFYNDIQQMVIERTNERRNTFIAAAILAGLSLALLFSINGSQTLSVAGIVSIITILFTVIVWVGVLIDAVKGSMCRFHIRTGIQDKLIPGVRRVRKAEKILEQIRPLSSEAQGGELALGDFGRAADWSFPGMGRPPSVLSENLSVTAQFLAFAMTGALGGALWLLPFFQNLVVVGFALVALVGSALSAVIAMARPANNRVDRSLNVICGAALGADGLLALGAYVGFMIVTMVSAIERGAGGGAVNEAAELAKGLDAVLTWLNGFPLFQILGSGFAGLGLVGLVRLARLGVPVFKTFVKAAPSIVGAPSEPASMAGPAAAQAPIYEIPNGVASDAPGAGAPEAVEASAGAPPAGDDAP